MSNQLFKNAFVAYSKFYCALFDEIVKLPPQMQRRLGGFEIELRMATNYFWELLMMSYNRREGGKDKILSAIPDKILVQAEGKAIEGAKNLAATVSEAQKDSNGLIRVLSESLRPYYDAQKYFPFGVRAGNFLFG